AAGVKACNRSPHKIRTRLRRLGWLVVANSHTPLSVLPSKPKRLHKERSPGLPPIRASSPIPARRKHGIGNYVARRCDKILIRTCPTANRATCHSLFVARQLTYKLGQAKCCRSSASVVRA